MGKDKDHIYLHLNHLPPELLAERLPGFPAAAILAASTSPRSPFPSFPPFTTTWAVFPPTTGGIVAPKNGDDAIVPGLLTHGRGPSRPVWRQQTRGQFVVGHRRLRSEHAPTRS